METIDQTPTEPGLLDLTMDYITSVEIWASATTSEITLRVNNGPPHTIRSFNRIVIREARS